MDAIRAAIYETVEADHPATVRQIFYRLVSTGVIDKTEAEYKGTVCRLLVELRETGRLPYSWIADNTRWMRKPRTYDSLSQMLQITKDTYRRALWANQLEYVEIWCEKDALTGVLIEETEPWDVPLMVTRGYPSVSFLYEAAAAIAEQAKPAYFYYLGDWDPSGVDIPRQVERRLRQYAPNVELHFERIAVGPVQIYNLNLPTRPTKKSDSRAKGFHSESVEVDAIPPAILRALVSKVITRHVHRDSLEIVLAAEESERNILAKMAANYDQGVV